ncbi:MAG: hypothetical protein RR552_01140 [Oscillospiraceae bacterium]
MLFYKPITNLDEIKFLFNLTSTDENSVYGAYIAVEGDKQLGKCIIKIDNMNCEISNLEVEINDELLIEGLLRASLNFAGNRNAYMARCSDEKIKDILLLLGFQKKDDYYEGDIPTLLLGSCCKH